MKPGDYVQYRNWKEGDPPLSETPEWRRGWGQTGMIVELGDWRVGGIFWPGEMALIWTGDSYIELCTRDIKVISSANFVSSFSDNRAKTCEFMV